MRFVPFQGDAGGSSIYHLWFTENSVKGVINFTDRAFHIEMDIINLILTERNMQVRFFFQGDAAGSSIFGLMKIV